MLTRNHLPRAGIFCYSFEDARKLGPCEFLVSGLGLEILKSVQ